MTRTLALFFDGTWNTAPSDTNVRRLFLGTDAATAFEATMGGSTRQTSDPKGDLSQVKYYHPGVGTKWDEKLRGGAFGYGLSRNIKDGYLWLTQAYEPGDRLFIFGFSRGAYTARSLVGLMRKCGIPREPLPGLVREAYHIYREKQWAPDGREAAAFKATFSWPDVRVAFIGVWDTVGALGVPVHQVPFGSDWYRWHDTDLSRMVENAYHAIALDEHRPDFNATLWSNTKAPAPHQYVEQRWFSGSHGDVGGGYPDGMLWQIPLAWMEEAAARHGFGLRTRTTIDPGAHLSAMHDSLDDFALGLYRRLPWIYPYFRVRNNGVNETIDGSVWARIQDPDGRDERGSAYRPPSLGGARSPADLVAGSVVV